MTLKLFINFTFNFDLKGAEDKTDHSLSITNNAPLNSDHSNCKK